MDSNFRSLSQSVGKVPARRGTGPNGAEPLVARGRTLGLGESEAVEGGDRLANEHRTAFGVEGAIGGEQLSVRAKEIEPAAYRRTRPADGRVIIEQPGIRAQMGPNLARRRFNQESIGLRQCPSRGRPIGSGEKVGGV
jgi:hypothetical protein